MIICKVKGDRNTMELPKSLSSEYSSLEHLQEFDIFNFCKSCDLPTLKRLTSKKNTSPKDCYF